MNTVVKDVMTSRVVWVRKDAPYRELAAALRENRVSAFPVLDDEGKVIGVVSEASRLPVVDSDGHLTGIISRADVLSVFDRSDHEIREGITGNVILDEFRSYFPRKG